LSWWVTPLGFRVTLVLVSNTSRLPCDICLGEHYLHSYSKLSHIITLYSYTKHSFQHWSNSKGGYTSFYTTALSYVPLLRRMSHCFVARPTALSHVPLLCRASYYFNVVFTTPPWVPLLCRGLHYSAVRFTYPTAYKSTWFVSISC
jgi:hypothetical protein